MDLDPFTQKRTYRIEGLFQRQDKSSTIKNENIVEVVTTSKKTLHLVFLIFFKFCHLQSKMKYTSPKADITQESTTTTTH